MSIPTPTQTKNAINDNVTLGTMTGTFTSTPAIGAAVILAIAGNSQTSVSTVTDNQTGNSYSKLIAEPTSAGLKFAEIWWCPKLVGASGTFTVTAQCTGTGTVAGSIGMIEAPGLAGTSDQTGVGQATATSLTVTASGANTSADSLVVSCILISNDTTHFTSGTMPSGYTAVSFTNTNSNASSSGGCYKIVSAVETSSAAWTWTTSGVCAGVIATFQGAFLPLGAQQLT